MNIKTLVVGELQCNCYILEKNDKVIIVDPGDEFDKIKKEVGNKEVVLILITHSHFDHVSSLNDCINYYNAKVFKYDNLEEKEYNISSFCFDVIFTLGHTDDSVTYYFKDDNVMFTGDFIFKNNIGRCDLPTGNFSSMLMSISKIKNYDDKIVIYPGHGDSSTLGNEKKFNYYFNL